jgi:hypothetical protein
MRGDQRHVSTLTDFYLEGDLSQVLLRCTSIQESWPCPAFSSLSASAISKARSPSTRSCSTSNQRYANFAITEPALKLVLLEGEPGQDTVLDHLGVEVESTEEVDAASKRLTGEGMETCCYALQDKVWAPTWVTESKADTPLRHGWTPRALRPWPPRCRRWPPKQDG